MDRNFGVFIETRSPSTFNWLFSNIMRTNYRKGDIMKTQVVRSCGMKTKAHKGSRPWTAGSRINTLRWQTWKLICVMFLIPPSNLMCTLLLIWLYCFFFMFYFPHLIDRLSENYQDCQLSWHSTLHVVAVHTLKSLLYNYLPWTYSIRYFILCHYRLAILIYLDNLYIWIFGNRYCCSPRCMNFLVSVISDDTFDSIDFNKSCNNKSISCQLLN